MNAPAHPEPTRDPPFDDAEFERLATFADRTFGLKLSPAKKPLVYSRISKRLQALRLDSLGAYINLVESSGENGERLELVSALTTNVTSFFREKHHFEAVLKDVLPMIETQGAERKRARFWSAGCSSGEEPYSLAMTILDGMQSPDRFDVKILATDIDPKVVAKARAGVYSAENVVNIEKTKLEKYFSADSTTNRYEATDRLKRLITFGELNLVEELPVKGPFDAIFCRNVAIYFGTETQQKIWKSFADLLLPGGHLFIGHSERVSGPAMDTLSLVGVTSYRKLGMPAQERSRK